MSPKTIKWPYGTIVHNRDKNDHIVMIVHDDGARIVMTTISPYRESPTSVLSMYDRGKVWGWNMGRQFWERHDEAED